MSRRRSISSPGQVAPTAAVVAAHSGQVGVVMAVVMAMAVVMVMAGLAAVVALSTSANPDRFGKDDCECCHIVRSNSNDNQLE